MREGTVCPDGGTARRHRIERGFTQEELADEAGLSKRTIEKIEAGKPVYVRTMAEVAAALDVPLKQLLAGNHENGPIECASPEETPARLGMAPPLPWRLVGRDADLQNIIQRLTPSPAHAESMPTQTVTAVRGWPGVGKTSIARAIAHSLRIADSFREGVLWTSLGPCPVILPELRAWGRAVDDLDLSSAESIAEASARLSGLLRQRNMLLIVDDAWEASHVAPFAVGGRCCAMLVTTRSREVAESLSSTPDDTYWLDVLDEQASLDLLRSLAPKVIDAYPSHCRELAGELEGLPLALQVAGRLLRAKQSRGWSVRQLLAELRTDAAQLLSARAPTDMASAPGEVSPTVTALLHRSTDALDPAIRKHFARLAPFAPRPATFELEDMACVWKLDTDETRRTVDMLVDRGLLEPVGDGDYQIHQILMEHAKTLLPQR